MSNTKTVLFAAHDMGGARVIAPVVDACRAAGHRIAIVEQGPARGMLKGVAVIVIDAHEETKDVPSIMNDLSPAVVVTGTSASATLEHSLWAAARGQGVPSVAILDASINLATRFRRPQSFTSKPDVICVIDAESRRELEQQDDINSRIEVVGQPHLEMVGGRIGRSEELNSVSGRFVFFSEPIVVEPGEKHPIGFEQFSVAESIVSGLVGQEGVTLVIKPHPNETAQVWRDWIARTKTPDGIKIELGTGDALTLMAGAQGVLGMASMALIEAALAGIPALSLQPGRTYCPNPRIDSDAAIGLVTDPGKVIGSIRDFADAARANSRVSPTEKNPFAGSVERVMGVIDDMMDAVSVALIRETKS